MTSILVLKMLTINNLYQIMWAPGGRADITNGFEALFNASCSQKGASPGGQLPKPLGAGYEPDAGRPSSSGCSYGKMADGLALTLNFHTRRGRCLTVQATGPAALTVLLGKAMREGCQHGHLSPGKAFMASRSQGAVDAVPEGFCQQSCSVDVRARACVSPATPFSVPAGPQGAEER